MIFRSVRLIITLQWIEKASITVIRWSIVRSKRTDHLRAMAVEFEFVSRRYKIIMRYCKVLSTIMLAILVANKLATKK